MEFSPRFTRILCAVGVVGFLLVWANNPADPGFYNLAYPLGLVILAPLLAIKVAPRVILATGGAAALAMIVMTFQGTDGTPVDLLLEGLLAAGLYAPVATLLFRRTPEALLPDRRNETPGEGAEPDTTPATSGSTKRQPSASRVVGFGLLAVAGLIEAAGIAYSILDGFSGCTFLCGIEVFIAAMVAVPVAMIGIAFLMRR